MDGEYGAAAPVATVGAGAQGDAKGGKWVGAAKGDKGSVGIDCCPRRRRDSKKF